MDSLTFLAKKATTKIQPVYVVHGDEDFLKRQVLQALRALVLGEQNDDFAMSAYAGDTVDYATVMDDLRTLPFFGPRRLVVVDNADNFVTRYRAALEKAIGNLPSSGSLVLDVKTWPATTRLAKMIDDKGTIVCKAPAAAKLAAWCVESATTNYGKQLTSSSAALLVDLVGQEMGVLDQELQKLAAYVGNRARIGEEDVDKLVGRSQGANIWKTFDVMGDGDVKEALEILERLLDAGEEPIRIMGAFSMKLKQLAQAGRLAQQGQPLASALQEAGVPTFYLPACVKLMKHLGRARTNRLYEWLLEINMDLRGDSTLAPRALLERLVIRLARKPENLVR
jgi:DNA polymerase-3 subunit delta